MKNQIRFPALGVRVFVLAALAAGGLRGATALPAQAGAAPGSKLPLRDGWQIQPSAEVREQGETLSTTAYHPQGWHPCAVPSTVFAALVADKTYPDPYFGMNLRKVPGESYPIGANFSNLRMPADSPFHNSWWYRTEFDLPPSDRGRTVWLHFGGINYRANIWLNGHEVAASDKVAGMWRVFEFNVTGMARPGERNAIAVEVFPPQPDDLSITWVDWNPMPPDKDMGLWREVYVTTRGPVALRYPQVITHLVAPGLSPAHAALKGGATAARLTVSAELQNTSDRPVKGMLKGRIGKISFSQHVELAARETKRVTFSPDEVRELTISHPHLWWPYQMGKQYLYDLNLEFETGGQVSDRQSVTFGIREVTSELDAENHRLFKINGRKILIRGGGWAPDMLLRASPERQEEEIQYVRDMHLNTLRLEGKIEDEHFFNLCDRYGILVIAGWCCCDHWEMWKKWKAEDYLVAGESLRDQLRRLRNHPCMLDWLYGSDNAPPPKVEMVYLKALREEQWPNPYQASAASRRTQGSGLTGVKMSGPYDYVAPGYWLEDTANGGAFGFNTETSPGAAIPVIESIHEMLPARHLWPIDEYWDFHAGGEQFKNLNTFTRALSARYGKATSLEDYVEKAQLMNYEGERAMFEAYGRNKYQSTGVIQWMLNNAWPSVFWHLYDYYLRPGGGYFGTKKACEPLHVQYSYDDRSVVVVNSTENAFAHYRVAARVYNLDLAEKFSRETTVDVAPDSSARVFTLPPTGSLAGLSRTYFVKLTLEDSAGKTVSDNFYWLSTHPDVSNWHGSTWYYTPIQSYADLTELAKLPPVELKVTSQDERQGDAALDHVTLENPSTHLAFFVHLEIRKGQGGKVGGDVAPVLWEDNYFSLLPGEKKTVTATYQLRDLGGAEPVVRVDGWNVKPATH
ncbi:MAG TPA: glycoside hydrolase family 2 protein [Terriglobia bacterium]|nr:glycoside hydrolase family 2 protein [Terriglobia bacterium]